MSGNLVLVSTYFADLWAPISSGGGGVWSWAILICFTRRLLFSQYSYLRLRLCKYSGRRLVFQVQWQRRSCDCYLKMVWNIATGLTDAYISAWVSFMSLWPAPFFCKDYRFVLSFVEYRAEIILEKSERYSTGEERENEKITLHKTNSWIMLPRCGNR